MKSLSTLLAALAVSGTATALVGLDAKPALACNPYCNMPRQGFAIESSSIGSMTFSGAGTALFNQSEGQRNSVEAGTSSSLSYSTSLSTSPNYGGSASVSVSELEFGNMSQGIGVADQTTSGAANAALTGATFDGIFKADIATESGANNTESRVDITGLMATTDISVAGSSVNLDTGILGDNADENGTASASAAIASGTTANAQVSGSTFASGFMQYFAPGAGFDSVSFDGGHEDVTVSPSTDPSGNGG